MSDALNRRGFLGLAGGLGLAALTGCGSDGQAAAQPTQGGRLRAVYAGGGAKEVLDPHVQSLFVDIARHKAMYEKLVELGPDLKPVPRLAEKWESDAQAATWRFTLRDATFHDGAKLTSEDVLYSLARIADPKVPERVAQSSLATLDVRRSKAIDPRTVELTLSAPNAEFPALLAGIGTQIVRDGFTDPTRPIGTGAFRFVSFDAGRSMVAARYDDYWDDPARIDELHILSADAEARANAVQGGQAEYANDMTATFARTAEAGKTVRIVAAKASTMQAFVLKCDQPPFDNPDVRMAFKLLADRQRLVDVVLAGRGAVGNDLFGKGYQYYPDGLPQRERNVEEAKALLKKAGLVNKEIEIFTADASAGFVEAATLFAEQVPLPSLLVISVVAVGWRASAFAITLAVAMVNVPTVARLVRAAALCAASGPVVEALRMQRESWFGIHLGYVGRAVLGPVAADIGTRITLAVFLVASVNFLGLGLSPTAPDWAVSVSRNREGLLLQPWAVIAPALMLVSFTLGFNLLADRLVHRSSRLLEVSG